MKKPPGHQAAPSGPDDQETDPFKLFDRAPAPPPTPGQHEPPHMLDTERMDVSDLPVDDENQLRERLDAAPGAAADQPFVELVLNKTYKLTSLISKGMVSSVYTAINTRLPNKRFALKMLNPSLKQNPEAYARFRREAEVATAFEHPHIVDVIDFNITEDGNPYLVMELLQGEDLAGYLKRHFHLSSDQLLPIISQVGSGLQAAHDGGIIHRDVKPENIFLVQSGRGVIHSKILDFGFSKMELSDSGITDQNIIIGTPYYMAPEQTGIPGAKIDHTTDIFSFGCVCYQMITGKLPFYAATIYEVFSLLRHKDPVPISTLRPEIPPAVDQIVMRALAKDKQDRYQRVEQFVEELTRLLEDHSTTITGPVQFQDNGSALAAQRPAAAANPPAGSAGAVGEDEDEITIPGQTLDLARLQQDLAPDAAPAHIPEHTRKEDTDPGAAVAPPPEGQDAAAAPQDEVLPDTDPQQTNTAAAGPRDEVLPDTDPQLTNPTAPPRDEVLPDTDPQQTLVDKAQGTLKDTDPQPNIKDTVPQGTPVAPPQQTIPALSPRDTLKATEGVQGLGSPLDSYLDLTPAKLPPGRTSPPTLWKVILLASFLALGAGLLIMAIKMI